MCNIVARIGLLSFFLTVMILANGCSKEPRNTQPQISKGATGSEQKNAPSANVVSSEASLLAVVEHLRGANPTGESHTPQTDVQISALGRGVAYIAEQNGQQYVVHNGKPGKFHTEISHLVISPDGQHVSYSCTALNHLQMVVDGIASELFVDVYDAVFSPDSRHCAYLAEDSNKMMHIVLDGKTIDESTNVFNAGFLFSNDSAKLVYHATMADNGTSLIIYDLKSGGKTVMKCLEIPIVMNDAKDRIAAAAGEGRKQQVMDFPINAPGNVHKSGLFDSVSNITLGGDGKTVAFIGVKNEHRYLVMNGTESRLPDDLLVRDDPVVRPDLKGAGIILATKERYNSRSVFRQTMKGDGTREKWYEQIKDVAYDRVNNASAYVAKEGEKCFVVLNGKEGPAFDMIVMPMFSPDGTRLVYRAREGAKRFVVVADASGKILRRHPEHEMVFSTVFTADGKSVAYGAKDGNQLVWKVEKL